MKMAKKIVFSAKSYTLNVPGTVPSTIDLLNQLNEVSLSRRACFEIFICRCLVQADGSCHFS